MNATQPYFTESTSATNTMSDNIQYEQFASSLQQYPKSATECLSNTICSAVHTTQQLEIPPRIVCAYSDYTISAITRATAKKLTTIAPSTDSQSTSNRGSAKATVAKKPNLKQSGSASKSQKLPQAAVPLCECQSRICCAT